MNNRAFQREESIDIAKGLCVVAMTIHHCINYFPALPLGYWRFVSGAFPFLAGFVTAGIVRDRYSGKGGAKLAKKLFIKGLKLILLCIGLNILVALLLPDSAKFRLDDPLAAAGNAFIFGDYTTVSFSLLVPIGYVLVGAGVMAALGLFRLGVVGCVAGLLFLYCSWNHFSTNTGYYVCYFSIGMLGLLFGFCPKVVLKDFLRKSLVPLGAWSVTVGLTFVAGQPFPIYTAYVFTSVLLCLQVGTLFRDGEIIARCLAQAGRYSLMLYLFQIAFLVVLHRALARLGFSNGVNAFFIALSFLIVAQIILTFVTSRVRQRLPVIDKTYRFFFA